MATPFALLPVSGVDLVSIIPTADLTSLAQRPAARLGTEVFGSDGKRYVYGQANASISASTAVCTVNASTFLVTASGGAYTSPATAMVAGDQGWFGAASV
ncbi:MAG: hypothetical protein KGI54_08935 [Pseudomonadota bacterium]|nr:hypothetical protein [Pseudomonadota bacterium]